MAVFEKITKNMVLTMGEEHSVASFYKWLKDLFDHSEGYPLLFDKDFQTFDTRKLGVYPSILVNQIDNRDLVETFFGGRSNKMGLLFYVYFLHHREAEGSRRLLRRGRDQISFAFKMAGIMNDSKEFVVPPVKLWDFSKTPIEDTGRVLTVLPGIQQRFLQDVELLQYEFLVGLTYMEDLPLVPV